MTGSRKRDNFVHTMIFRYKHCCSKTPNILSFIKKNWLLKDGYLNLFHPECSKMGMGGAKNKA